MDKRPIVYGYEQGRTFDLLSGIVYAMQGDSRIALDLMGGAGTTVVSGGAATATSPATLSINVAPISIYQLGPTDATTYGALSADSLQILQVGHNDTASTVTFSTSTLTSGQSMWALVEASFVTADSIAPSDPNNGLLLYFNPTNPSSPYQGQNNNGQPQNTLRSNTVQLNVVYGAVATSGSQVPPNPSAGAVPLYLVDLTYGRTQVTTILTAGPSVGTNVPSNYPYAPFLAGLLNSHHSGTPGQAPQINLATETQGNFNRVVQVSEPAQFDNSNSIATTSFVQRALGNLQGYVPVTTTPYTVQTSDAGKAFYLLSGASIVTLPLLSSVPTGTTYWFSANIGPCTINCSGTDMIDDRSSGAAPSISINASEDVFITSKGTVWYCFGGTFPMRKAAQNQISGSPFLAVLAGSGYQKLPSGLIIQWGQTGSIFTINNNSGQMSSPFPIAFPNVCLSVQLTTTYGFNNGSATDVPVANGWNPYSFQWQFWSPNNGNGGYPPWVQFFAIGY